MAGAGSGIRGAAGVIIFTYRRDTRELGRWACLALASLRIAAVTGLLVAYLRPQWRNEREVVQNSRALVLVDTSLSMEVDDQDASPAEPNRAQQIAALLAENKFLDQLRRMHDVSVWTVSTKPFFDKPVVHPAAPAIHAHVHPRRFHRVDKHRRGELRALIGVEISGACRPTRNAASQASTQKAASIVLLNRQPRT